MHALLRQQAAEAGLSDVYEVIGCGAQELKTRGGIAPGSIDTIITVQSLCSIPTPQVIIRELYPLLKPGGKWLMYEHVKTKYQSSFVGYWQSRWFFFLTLFFLPPSFSFSLFTLLCFVVDVVLVLVVINRKQRIYLSSPTYANALLFNPPSNRSHQSHLATLLRRLRHLPTNGRMDLASGRVGRRQHHHGRKRRAVRHDSSCVWIFDEEEVREAELSE